MIEEKTLPRFSSAGFSLIKSFLSEDVFSSSDGLESRFPTMKPSTRMLLGGGVLELKIVGMLAPTSGLFVLVVNLELKGLKVAVICGGYLGLNLSESGCVRELLGICCLFSVLVLSGD